MHPVNNMNVIERTDLFDATTRLLAQGFRLASVAGHDDVDAVRVVYVFIKGPPDERNELVVLLDRDSPEVPSLAAVSFSASRFERELHDLLGVLPVGHPSPRRLVLHQHWPDEWFALRRSSGAPPAMLPDAAPYPFAPVEGPGVYEVPVGPVHAGLIEPGHFRFFVVGETILRLKARLWFVHKGIERLVEGESIDEALQVAQRISGDTTVGHGLAFALAAEEALGIEVATEHHIARAVVLELERLYNHVSDIGALCNDVGYSIANAMAQTIREHLLRLNEQVTGHRLLRGGVQIGGSALLRLPKEDELRAIGESIDEMVAVIRSNALVLDRFTDTARLRHDDAVALGTLGVVARASGIDYDARISHPFVTMPPSFSVATFQDGDVRARFDVRVAEIGISLNCLRQWRHDLDKSPGDVRDRQRTPRPGSNGSGRGIVEGWRGTIIHRVELTDEGDVRRLKIVDPSFFNWPALPVCLADTILPDFPLVNKSFNLSYAGNDL